MGRFGYNGVGYVFFVYYPTRVIVKLTPLLPTNVTFNPRASSGYFEESALT